MTPNKKIADTVVFLLLLCSCHTTGQCIMWVEAMRITVAFCCYKQPNCSPNQTVPYHGRH